MEVAAQIHVGISPISPAIWISDIYLPTQLLKVHLPHLFSVFVYLLFYSNMAAISSVLLHYQASLFPWSHLVCLSSRSSRLVFSLNIMCNCPQFCTKSAQAKT